MNRQAIIFTIVLFVFLFFSGLSSGYKSYVPRDEKEISSSIWDNEDYDYESYMKGYIKSYDDTYADNFVDGWLQYEADNGI